MHIIIPMSGIGKRFLDAGYKDPKPLIHVDGKPIIEHVVNLFPGETNFTFICNEDHLSTTTMRSTLTRIAPRGRIVAIPPHKKGPVFAVAQAFDHIDDDNEVIINYCDFSTYWDYKNFLLHTRSRNADGAIPAYKGFHPHMLGTTNYAFMRDDKQFMTDIKEKEPFTDNRMQEYASNGTYYFKSGALVKKYFTQLMQTDITLKGEYYVSLVYKLLAQDTLTISIYQIQHMLQWGTPQDLEEYQRWSNFFSHVLTKKNTLQYAGLTLIPLAGRGQRFVDAGYTTPKPLIPIGGKPMIVQASSCLPRTSKQIFVCQREHLTQSNLAQKLDSTYSSATIIPLDHITQGQACTCEIGLQNQDLDLPLLIGACDNGMLFDEHAYQTLVTDPTVDAIVWSFKNHPSSNQNPHMYGWLSVDESETITGVSVKTPISQTPANDHAIVGTFYFKKARYFLDALNSLYKKNRRINNEFYVDSCVDELVAMGLCVKVFEVDHYLCWGTPNDLLTFEYWQSFFHKCPWHSYTLEKDPTVKQEVVPALHETFTTFGQANK